VTPDQTQPSEPLSRLFRELDREAEGSPPGKIALDSPITDALSWRAPPRVTKSRRLGILLWALGYLGTGKAFLALAILQHSIPVAVLSAILLAAGVKIACNGLHRNAPRDPAAGANHPALDDEISPNSAEPSGPTRVQSTGPQ
jgi:hypothetical protein